jgi:hypothetical protein
MEITFFRFINRLLNRFCDTLLDFFIHLLLCVQKLPKLLLIHRFGWALSLAVNICKFDSVSDHNETSVSHSSLRSVDSTPREERVSRKLKFSLQMLRF